MRASTPTERGGVVARPNTVVRVHCVSYRTPPSWQMQAGMLRLLNTNTSRALGGLPRQLGQQLGVHGRRPLPARRGVATAMWDATGLSQQQLMLKDQCVVVDEADNVIGLGSKRTVHRFEKDTPTGLLHRAFSVFLFDASGRLLLQQRAAEKITFPGV
jgi:hypothetical protein